VLPRNQCGAWPRARMIEIYRGIRSRSRRRCRGGKTGRGSIQSGRSSFHCGDGTAEARAGGGDGGYGVSARTQNLSAYSALRLAMRGDELWQT
jgi:hypothetical protein